MEDLSGRKEGRRLMGDKMKLMSKFDFKKEKIIKFLCFVWLVFLPLLRCIFDCLKTGNSIKEIYLPSSWLNDELIYYKEVEGMVHYGMPLGYFGYSENHAVIGTLSVWSPMLLMPWYLWGILFGWNMLSPIWCNIVLLMLAMGIFYLLVKPDWKQTLWISVFYRLFLYFTRYALSATVDIPVYAFLIVVLGLIYSVRKRFSYKKLAALYMVCTVLTLMRPYFILLSMIPGYLWYRKSKKSLGIGAGIFLLQLAAYFAMSHYFCSPYFDGQSLLQLDWMKMFFEEGFKAGLKNFLYIFLSSWNTYLGYLGSSLNVGDSRMGNAGIMYAVVFGLFCYKLVLAVRKKEQEEIIWNGFWAAYYVIMFFAAVYLFGIDSGQRHFLCFTVIGLFVFAIDGIDRRRMVLLSMMMVYFFVLNTTEGGYAWTLPYVDSNVQEELTKGETVLQNAIELTDTISYDNTIVWVFDDVVDEKIVHSKWQMLYALPPGMGINVYLLENIRGDLSNIRSKYIFVAENGRTDQRCQEIGAKKLAEYGDSVIYQLRD